MLCEKCNIEHDGSYGSGRFCSSKCARSFSTENKREQINKKVSESLSGRKGWNNCGFKSGYDDRRFVADSEHAKKMNSLKVLNFKEKVKVTPFEELSKYTIRNILLNEYNNCCSQCGISEWNNKKLPLELDHIDGNNKNNSKENLRILCPNCHSQTDTWRRKK